ncbi:hypothetical protein J1N35_040894, partial [Gossypium stocksii]
RPNIPLCPLISFLEVSQIFFSESLPYLCCFFTELLPWCLQMGKGCASDKVMAKVLAEFEHIVSASKFKRHKVLTVRGFPPRCGRVTASNFDLSR